MMTSDQSVSHWLNFSQLGATPTIQSWCRSIL